MKRWTLFHSFVLVCWLGIADAVARPEFPDDTFYKADKKTLEESFCIMERRMRAQTATDAALCTSVEKELWDDATFLLGELRAHEVLTSTKGPDLTAGGEASDPAPLIDLSGFWLGALLGAAAVGLVGGGVALLVDRID